jgi:hypothetical protein
LGPPLAVLYTGGCFVSQASERMPEHIVFLTGKLAERNLRGELEQLAADEFTYDVVRLPISVAGLMTADFI